jgi:hypothetical protein
VKRTWRAEREREREREREQRARESACVREEFIDNQQVTEDTLKSR